VAVRSAPAKLAEPAAKTPRQAPDPVEAHYSPTYEKCLSSGAAAQGVTPAMAGCAAAEIAAQDGLLNRTYQAVLAGSAPEQRPKLREAQRAWIVFRDAKCASENQTGGTIDSIGGPICILRATVVRTTELEAMQKTY
jgi:uncharacterized protein YecT (DUF1311 family)